MLSRKLLILVVLCSFAPASAAQFERQTGTCPSAQTAPAASAAVPMFDASRNAPALIP